MSTGLYQESGKDRKYLSLEGWRYEKRKRIWEANSRSHLGLMIRTGSRLGMPGYWLLARHEICLIRTGKGLHGD